MASRIRAAVFDYGGVLTTPVRESIAAWLEADAVRPETFSRTLKAWLSRDAADGTPIHRLETGELDSAEFERLLAAELGTNDGSPVAAAGLLARLFRGMRVDPAMSALVAELRRLGMRTVLLSNSWGGGYPYELLDELFDDVVISGEVGLRKPDPRIYRLALGRSGVVPHEAVFVDDAEPNTEAAAALGMHAVLHSDPSTTRTRLAELVPTLNGAAMRTFEGLEELARAKGESLGTSNWHTVTQEQVDLFAEATGDHQWIHVDPERAAKGPFGTTIAHGYLTLSLIPLLTKEIYQVNGISMGVNYGTEKVRFPSPVPVGSRVRASAELVDVAQVKQGTQVVARVIIEIEGQDKPACVAEVVSLLVP